MGNTQGGGTAKRGDFMKPYSIIVDLDGTLCNTDHRIFNLHKTPKDWDAWNAGLGADQVNMILRNVLAGLCACVYHPTEVLIVTGRYERYRSVTENWLHSKDVDYDRIWMRRDGDMRSDATVKEEIYLKFIEPNYNVDLVFEDRDRVVKMWRSLGLVCWQVKEGDY